MSKYTKYGFYLLFLGLFGVLFGVSFAFFNYTRTGSSNTVRVGNLTFNATSGTAINLDNVFVHTCYHFFLSFDRGMDWKTIQTFFQCKLYNYPCNHPIRPS